MKTVRFATAIMLIVSAACEKGFTDPNGDVPSVKMVVDGLGNVSDRYTAELWVVGNVGYTTTWGSRNVNSVTSPGNAIKIWNVGGAVPVLVDSVIVTEATTLGDIQVSDDGKRVPLDVAEGDEVLYSKYGGTEIKVNGDDLLVLRESDVLAKVV